MAGTSARIFKSDSNLPIDKIFKLLKSAKKIVDVVDNPETGEPAPLEFFMESLEMKKFHDKDVIRGILTYDDHFEVKGQDNFIKLVINRRSSPFTIFSGSTYVVPFVKSTESDDVITKIYRLSPSSMNIEPCSISTTNIEDFLNHHPHHLTACAWHGLNIPGLSRSSLSGPNIANTEDFSRYDDRGKKRYVRVLMQSTGWSLTINDKASLHFFTSVPKEHVEKFISDEIIPRCD